MMPPEGPNKAEELLQRYAKERRERGGDFSLHPATRQLWQGEVAREFAKARRQHGRWLGFWEGWKRARFVVGGALATIAIVSITLIATRRGSRQELARGISPRAEKELLFARTEQLVKAAKEPSPVPADSYKKDGGRGFADFDIAAKPKAPGVAPAQNASVVTKPQDVALLADMAAVALNSGGSYSGSLVRAQNAPAAPNGTVTQQSLPNVQLGLSYTAPVAGPQSVAGANADAASVQFGAPAVNNSLLANSDLAPNDEAKFGKNAVLQKQFVGGAGAVQFANPSLRAPRPQQSAAAATASAEPVDKLLSEQLARRDAPTRYGEVQTGQMTELARYYRLNISMDDRVAQRTVNGTAGRAAAAATPAATEASQAVLNQFTIERQGNSLRLRDADGSVYEGALTLIAAAARPGGFGLENRRSKDSVEQEKLAELKEEGLERPADLSFLLTGTNMTSGQLVTVRGRFEPATNSAPMPALLARRLAITAGTREERQSGDTKSAAEPLVIDGTVRIGDGNEQPFRAVPARQ